LRNMMTRRRTSISDSEPLHLTTFETSAYFPDDGHMRRELVEIVEDARQKLATWLGEMIAKLEEHSTGYRADLEAIRDALLEQMRKGYPGRSLDSMMKLDTFGEPHFYFPPPEGMDPGTASEMAGHAFFVRVLRLLWLRVTDRATCVAQPIFDRMVFQPYIAIMFALYATTDPWLYLPPRETG
jgi:hypothetical protein